jgi:hypothetical protein
VRGVCVWLVHRFAASAVTGAGGLVSVPGPGLVLMMLCRSHAHAFFGKLFRSTDQVFFVVDAVRVRPHVSTARPQCVHNAIKVRPRCV